MSMHDQYRELELYLKQAETEICLMLENETLQTDYSPATKIQNEEKIEINTKSYDEDTEIDTCLINIIDSIQSDVTELESKYELEKSKINENQFMRDDNMIMKCTLDDFGIIKLDDLSHLIKETDILSDDVDSTGSFENSIIFENGTVTTGTQTSPSFSSPISLSRGSECSSSPCLTSASDDLVEDDGHSLYSIDRECHHHYNYWDNPLHQPIVLRGKSSSAPVLKKLPVKVNRQSRSQSDRHLAEIEAAEACKWLRAAGFPQYARMYEDHQFPLDLGKVAHEHSLLDQDVLNSLFRRLQILNSCVHLSQQSTVAILQNPEEPYDTKCPTEMDNKIDSSPLAGRTLLRRSSEDRPRRTESLEREELPFRDRAVRRMHSIKFFRNRREGIVVNESGSKLLESLTEQLHFHSAGPSELPTPDSDSSSKQYSAKPDIPDVLPEIASGDEKVQRKLADARFRQSCIFSLNYERISQFSNGALLHWTAFIENEYKSKNRTAIFTAALTKMIDSDKIPVYDKGKRIFGVPLQIIVKRTGYMIPKNIEAAMEWLKKNAMDCEGLFRKPGVKSRIQLLKDMVEADDCDLDFQGHTPYDIADMVKLYFRELPEVLITTTLTEAFYSLFKPRNSDHRNEASMSEDNKIFLIQFAMSILPTEHAEVLMCLISLLAEVAKHADVNSMHPKNLSICLTSLFHYSSSNQDKALIQIEAAQECLAFMINHFNEIFTISTVPLDTLNRMRTVDTWTSASIDDDHMDEWKKFLRKSEKYLILDMKEKNNKNWKNVKSFHPNISISSADITTDKIDLKLWKVTTEMDATPNEILQQLLRNRGAWDSELVSWRILKEIDDHTDVYHYVRRRANPLPEEEYCLIRSWKEEKSSKKTCLLVETSVTSTLTPCHPNAVRAQVLVSKYYIELCGPEKSKLTHFVRVDTIGRKLVWHNSNYGHIAASFLAKIKNDFTQRLTRPETTA